jgi:hypothetical protein
VNVHQLQILIISLLLLSLQGCASFSLFGDNDVTPIEIKTVAIERTPLSLPNPPQLKPKAPDWYVVTPDNVDDVFAKLKDKNFDLVLFGVTDEGYEQLSITMAEIRNYIKTQKAIIIKYKEYYEPNKLTTGETQ